MADTKKIQFKDTEKTETNSFLPHSDNNQFEQDAMEADSNAGWIDWPSVESDAVNKYTTPFPATMVFLTVFPGG